MRLNQTYDETLLKRAASTTLHTSIETISKIQLMYLIWEFYLCQLRTPEQCDAFFD